MKPVEFELDVAPTGYAKVVVDGQDLTEQVVGATLYATRGQVPTLSLDIEAGGTIRGTAIIEARVPGDMLDQLAKLLEATDAAALEQEALNSPDLGADEGAVTRQCLRILAGRLRDGRP
jgi:hypothetical protein